MSGVSPSERAAIAREVLTALWDEINERENCTVEDEAVDITLLKDIEQYRDRVYPEPRPTLLFRGGAWAYEPGCEYRWVESGSIGETRYANPFVGVHGFIDATADEYRAAADCIEATERWLASLPSSVGTNEREGIA